MARARFIAGAAALAYVAALGFTQVSPAHAVKSWAGNNQDYSYEFSLNDDRLRTCNKTADSKATSGTRVTVYGHTYDQGDNQADNTCTNGAETTRIVRHQTCAVNWGPWPNDCGAWAYP